MRYLTRTGVCVTLCVLCLASPAFALFVVTKKGLRPKNWPEQLETLRETSVTYEGPKRPYRHYAIPFKTREEFELAWPHMVEVKSLGAPIVLRRNTSFWLGEGNAGVCIHTPPVGKEPISGDQIKPAVLGSSPFAGGRLDQTIYIELIIDGEIVDLNRIQLPGDTPIVDERFKEPEGK
jgi:hypothetical protein